MKLLHSKPIFLIFLALAGAAFSQKGGLLPPPKLKISSVVKNDATLMTLEWNTRPVTTYSVETRNLKNGWQSSAQDLTDVVVDESVDWKVAAWHLSAAIG